MQAFVRDPDGYYIEFCNCEGLEEVLRAVPKEEQEWNFGKAKSVFQVRDMHWRWSETLTCNKNHV